jgi:2-dehydro-3-deoxyphosphogluconate aldolase / (4S)-4-hydroxy-2-oxoglutarate aldolase
MQANISLLCDRENEVEDMKEAAIETILATRVVAIVRFERYDEPVRMAQALIAGGIRVVEFTFTGENASEAIAIVHRELGDEVCVGAGTVLQPDQAEEALAAGAQFLVTPAVRPSVMEICQKHHVAGICGALTPTEALAAHEARADLIKIFPARMGGPAHIRDLLGPFPSLRLIPTGGVSAENARAYLDAGAVAVGAGGNLVSSAALARGDWDQITTAARAYTHAVQ